MNGRTLHCLSVAQHDAGQDLVGRLAFDQTVLRAALRDAETAGIDRLMILSTCQRVELYSDAPDGSPPPLARWLARSRAVEPAAILTRAKYLDGSLAARHLCRVAAGLESTLLGEAQVLAQVASALSESIAAHRASPLLKRTARTAVRVGERARRVVWSRFPSADIGSVAVEAARRQGAPLTGQSVTIVGAGEVARLALRAIRAFLPRRLTVVNRSPERAARLAERYGGIACGLDRLPDLLCSSDVVIVATSAPAPVIDGATLAAVRRTAPLVIIDTGTPRNVEPRSGGWPGVSVVSLDELHEVMGSVRAERAGACTQVTALIDEELSAMMGHRTPGEGTGTARLASAG